MEVEVGRGRESISSQSQWSDRNEGLLGLVTTHVVSGTFLDTVNPTLILLRIRFAKHIACSQKRSPSSKLINKGRKQFSKETGSF